MFLSDNLRVYMEKPAAAKLDVGFLHYFTTNTEFSYKVLVLIYLGIHWY